MEWLAENHDNIDCYLKEVCSENHRETNFKFKGSRTEIISKMVFPLKAKGLIKPTSMGPFG